MAKATPSPSASKAEGGKPAGWVMEPPAPGTPTIPRPETAAPSAMGEPMGAPASPDHLATAAGTMQGTPWLSNLGWGVAAFGLALAAYSYWWTTENWPDNYTPGGLPADKLGMGLFVIGLIAGAVFVLVPWQRPTGFRLGAGKMEWTERARVAHYYWRASLILSWVGAGIFLLGLLLGTYVYRTWVVSGVETSTLTLAGMETTYGNWAGAFLGFGLVGAFLWATFSVRASSHRSAFQGFVAAAASGGGAMMMPTGGAPAHAAPLPAGVKEEEVVALMKKIDGLLAALPDDVVSAFSKTPEAETYLKLLGGK